MKLYKRPILICLFLTSISAQAADLSRFSGFGGSSFDSISVQNTTLNSRNSNFAYGAALESALTSELGAELGVIATQDRIQIPFLARLWGGRTFTFAAGPVADGVEKGKYKARIALAAGPGLNFHLSRKIDLFAEGRVMRAFQDGIFDINDKRTDFNALAGIRVALSSTD
jgi:hypothetical protein